MCCKAFLGCSATEAHQKVQYRNQHVSTRFERQFSMFSYRPTLWNKYRYYFQYRLAHSKFPIRMFLSAYVLLFLGLLLAGCSGSNTNPSVTATATATAPVLPVALAKLHWCGKPVQVFRDEGATKTGTPTVGVTPTTPVATPKTITDWQQVEPSLGFTVFLPRTLPQGSCLISASGTIHDPIFGGIFTIGYVLPNHDAFSLSEAPLAAQSSTFQCSPSSSTSGTKSSTPTPGPTTVPVQLCTGAHGTTNIVLSARGTTSSLQQMFNALQTNVEWEPAS
jgi:hypothetical protein